MQKRIVRIDFREGLFFLVLTVASLFLTYQTHRNNGYFNWKSEIWSDRAGYYIYLPAFFMYHFDAKKCPEKIDEKTGYGFTLDYQKNTINTKYTYGVAFLLSPFFVASHMVSPILHKPGDAGFGPVYHRMIDVAAVIYLILGLWILKRFLKYYFESSVQYLILFFIYAGTNLLFYTIDDTLMSHVYSFFLFTLFLLSMKRFLDEPGRLRYFILLSLAFAFIILIRPTNALILVLFFLWDARGKKEFRERIRLFFSPKRILFFCIIIFLVFLPQLIYWKYSRGSFFTYSYGNEGFTNWKSPRVAQVWFSTLNGLFIYTPMVLIMIAGMILMIVKRIPNGILTLGLFLITSYLFASWYCWYFGCSFGQRSYVEYYAIFSIPFGYAIRESFRIRNLLMKSIVVILLLSFCYYNYRMTRKFEKCFFGSSWDWQQFERQLSNAGLLPANTGPYHFMNDLENEVISYDFIRSDSIARSGMYGAEFTPGREFSTVFLKTFWDFSVTPPTSIETSCWIFNPGNTPTGALMVCTIEKDSVVNWQSKEMDGKGIQPGKWVKVTGKFIIPENLPMDHRVKIYIWNQRKSTFFVDDLDVTIK
jgi:hypothetical protein